MPGSDALKDIQITAEMVPRAVKTTRANQLRSIASGGISLYHEVLLRLSVPYDLSHLPAVETAVQEAVGQGLVELESVDGRPCLLKLPAVESSPRAVSRKHSILSPSGRSRRARYAGGGQRIS